MVSIGSSPGKYLIGLTGNIGTGKTTVRRMLEDLGAYGIDADDLVRNALDREGSAYGPVMRAFGRKILTRQGAIDHQKLALAVFNNHAELERLEAIVHPLVRREIYRLVAQASYYVVVVEAIKLIEGGLDKECDTVWVVQASQEQQLARVTKSRGMSTAQVTQRMQAQTPQASKAARADVIIRNNSSLKATRLQVNQQWRSIGSADAHRGRAAP